MSTQTKLSDEQVKAVALAASGLWSGLSFSETPEGHDYWAAIHARLQATVDNGTSDGKPWGGPSPARDIPAATVETPATTEDAATAVVIDDRWAAVWPRRWVMTSDTASGYCAAWSGPYRLASVDSSSDYPFRTLSGSTWRFCRPATKEELAKVERKQPPLGAGFQKATEADQSRPDRQVWDFHHEQWRPAQPGVVTASHYRVPVDVTPTAADATRKPTVLVWDDEGHRVVQATFLNYISCKPYPYVCFRDGAVCCYKHARFKRSYE